MSKPIVIGWLPADTVAISAAQTVLAGQNFIINGTLAANVPPNSFVSFKALNQSRTVSLTSAGDNSGVNFTVTGTYLNVVISETLAGPNANTVYTARIFDTVTSIVPNINTVGNVSVGSGVTGQTAWIQYDYNRAIHTVSVQVVVTGTINYTFQATLDDVTKNQNPFIFNPIATMIGATTSHAGNTNVPPFLWSNIIINSSDTTGSLIETYLESGIL